MIVLFVQINVIFLQTTRVHVTLLAGNDTKNNRSKTTVQHVINDDIDDEDDNVPLALEHCCTEC